MATVEHIALKARDLERTEVFYRLLGGQISRQPGGTRLSVSFGSGSRLLFDQTDALFEVGALSYMGIELDNFPEVDALLERLKSTVSIGRDLRDEFREATGPYGFFVTDPDGYPVKVFKYHTAQTD